MSQLHSNDAINAIKGLASALHLDKGYIAMGEGIKAVNQGLGAKGFSNAFTGVFKEANGEYNLAKVAGAGVGGMIGLRAGFGALRGTFTDSNGNFDMPGIPFI